MELTDLKVREYLDALKSAAPAPGGGAASAASGAQGTALLIMVLGLTGGMEKYSEFKEAHAEAEKKAYELSERLIKAASEDTAAYNSVAAAYKMPKTTDAEKKARSGAIQNSMIRATEVPLSVMKAACDGLEIISGLTGKTNPNASSDLGVGALCLTACVRGAWLNVKTNLPMIKDAEKAKEYEKEGQKIYDEAEKTAAQLYDYFLSVIGG